MTIGDFSRATRLSARALRLYHREGLLVPSRVEEVTGYRWYAPEQLADAQLVRRLRLHDMPLDEVRAVLTAPGPDERREALARHVRRMEARLAETRSALAGLRALLETDPDPVPVAHRDVPATRVVLVRAVIDLDDLGAWYDETAGRLQRLADSGLVSPTGPLGGLWSTALVADERGGAALFLPVAASATAPGDDVRVEVLPAVTLAVAVHTGPDETIGRAYAALGEHVARLGVGADGPVRESYLPDDVTEIGWPVTRTA